MSYEQAASTILLASHCIICGKALRDPDSVARGMGPDCSAEGYPNDGPNKDEANKLIHHAAIAATEGQIQTVLDNAKKVADLGWPEVAARMVERFKNAAKNAKIVIEVRGTNLWVQIPLKRDADYVPAMRALSGGKKERGRWYRVMPIAKRPQLWAFLQRWHPNVYGEGPKGLFRVPQPKVQQTTAEDSADKKDVND